MKGFKRAGNRSMPEIGREKGFRATRISIASDTKIDRLGRWSMNYIRVHARGISLETGGVQESQVSILWNCGLWAHHVG